MLLLRMSLAAGIGILLILVLRLLGRKKISAKVFAWLWCVMILRLLIPVFLPVNLQWEVPIVTDVQEHLVSMQDVLTQNILAQDFSAKEVSIEKIATPEERAEKMTFEIDPGVSGQEEKVAQVKMQEYIWAVGFLMCILYFLLRYRKEKGILSQSLPMTEKEREFIDGLSSDTWKEQIWISDQISSPVAFGFLRQRIVLPREFLKGGMKRKETNSLLCILQHESVHIQQHDNLKKAFCFLAVSIHWFNPFAWVMYYYFQRDLELACDEWALERLGREMRKCYAYALVNMAEYAENAKFALGSSFGRSVVRERMEAVMRYRKSRWMEIVGMVLALTATLGVFVHGAEESPVSIEIGEEGTSISIIGGADGPTSVFLAGKLAEEDFETVDQDDVEWVAVEEDDINRELTGLEAVYSDFMMVLEEYQDWELKYDSVSASLYYDGKPVGFLQDRISEDVYLYGFTSASENKNAVALRVTRDEVWDKMGISVMKMNDERVGRGMPAEDKAGMADGMRIFDLQTMLDYASEEALTYDALWQKNVNEYYESHVNDNLPWLPEHTVHLNRDMNGREDIGTLWIRFTSISSFN